MPLRSFSSVATLLSGHSASMQHTPHSTGVQFSFKIKKDFKIKWLFLCSINF